MKDINTMHDAIAHCRRLNVKSASIRILFPTIDKRQ